jgi:hypothetical protein
MRSVPSRAYTRFMQGRGRQNRLICMRPPTHTEPEPAAPIRHPCSTVTVRWLLTVCDATTRDRAALGGLTDCPPHGPTPVGAGRNGSRTGPPGSEGTTWPRCAQSPAGDHGHTSSTASMRRGCGTQPLGPWQNLSGLRALIWSADAVATATRGPHRTLRHVRARGRLRRGRPSPFPQPGQTTPPAIRQRKANPRSGGLCGAPWRDRTAYLLLTIYPHADAVANCRTAGQVRGGPLCCSPTYLFITPAKLSGDSLRPTTEGKQA